MPVILGGGIGGLTVGHYLLKYGNKLKTPITIIESTNRLGGWIKSKKFDNFIFESGPRTIRPSGNPGLNTLNLLEDVDLQSAIRPILSTSPAAKQRMIYVNNELHLLPSEFGDAMKKIPPFSKPLISSVLHDVFTGRSKNKIQDESIHSFAERRFGKEVADYLISAMICGICAGDAKEISVKFLMSDIFKNEQKYGGVVRGMVFDKLFSSKDKLNLSQLAQRAKDEKWSIYSLDGGLEKLPMALGDKLRAANVEINLETKCTNMQFIDDKVLLTVADKQLETDYLVSSIPSYRLSKLVRNQHPDLAEQLLQIPYVDVAVVNVQYNVPDLIKKKGFGFLVPPCENLPILGVIYDSCCFDMQGSTVLTVMMGGRWFKNNFGPDPAEQELLDVAKRYLRKILGIKIPPNTFKVQILRKCIPQYTVGHQDRVESIEKYVREHNLPLGLVGASYYGVGLNDVILSSKKLVDAKYSSTKAN